MIEDDKGTGTVLDYGANAENRLDSVEDGLTTLASYVHNAQGERVIKTAGSATTHYHYDQQGRLIAESDGSGAVTREHIALEGLPLALIDHGGVSPVLTHVHADHLGTPQVMTDGSKAVVWDLVQTPFGESYSLSATVANDNRLPGQRLETETGLHYNYFRDYDPDLGRYLQSDPIGLRGGLNTYAYVGANPVSYTDSLGLDEDGVRRYRIPIYRPPFALPNYEESVRKVCIEIQRGFDRLFNENTEEEAGPEAPKTIGNNPRPTKGGVNTDLSGGKDAAEELFDELTGGESAVDLKSGHRVGKNGVRIRIGDDGRARVDVPADVGPSGEHETIHFND